MGLAGDVMWMSAGPSPFPVLRLSEDGSTLVYEVERGDSFAIDSFGLRRVSVEDGTSALAAFDYTMGFSGAGSFAISADGREILYQTMHAGAHEMMKAVCE